MDKHRLYLDLEGVEKLAQDLAATLKQGDVLCLQGDLGAGKTTFARALIRSLLAADDNTEIPSPTFALVQSYGTDRFPVSHFDFYRIGSSDEVLELGLDEAVSDGIAIIEWPEKAPEFLSPDRLTIELSEGDDEERRELVFVPHGNWNAKLARFVAIQEFVTSAGWQDAECRFLQGDASTRRYMRLRNGERRAVLMDAPKQPDGPPVRDGKPYSQIAHLAEDVAPFYAVGQELRRIGLHAPEIFAHDLDQGLLLIEDFGDEVFGVKVSQGADILELYRHAVDVLVTLGTYSPNAELPVVNGRNYALPVFDREAMGIEVELLPDWYWPARKGEVIDQAERDVFMNLWLDQFGVVEQNLTTITLRDYHSPNLILLNGSATGIIDYQDAQRGNPAYDLVSLLQDARLTVPEDVERQLLDYYCEKRHAQASEVSFNEAEFRRDYAILGAQRNTKILGIFARLAKRDGKPGYLAHIPRIWTYVERDLSHPELSDLRGWYDRNFPPELRHKPLEI